MKQRVADQHVAVEIFVVHVHGRDLPVVIGGVVIDAPGGVAAA